MAKSLWAALLVALGTGAAAVEPAAAADWAGQPRIDAPSIIPAEEMGTGWVPARRPRLSGQRRAAGRLGQREIHRGQDRGHQLRRNGFGYKFNEWFRSDFTLGANASYPVRGIAKCRNFNCIGKAEETISVKAMDLMLNGYVDFGNWAGITPYIGAGIGAAYITGSEHIVKPLDGSPKFSDASSMTLWSLAASGMAGASYDLGAGFQLDAGYRYLWIDRGKLTGQLVQEQHEPPDPGRSSLLRVLIFKYFVASAAPQDGAVRRFIPN